MDKETAIKLFEDERVRVSWDAEQEEWFFSIIDVVGVLSESDNPRKYWSVLKTRLKSEGSQLATICSQLKMKAEDGKMRLTDVADTEQLLRLMQSPSFSRRREPLTAYSHQCRVLNFPLGVGLLVDTNDCKLNRRLP